MYLSCCGASISWLLYLALLPSVGDRHLLILVSDYRLPSNETSLVNTTVLLEKLSRMDRLELIFVFLDYKHMISSVRKAEHDYI